jgi:hypothetical protein
MWGAAALLLYVCFMIYKQNKKRSHNIGRRNYLDRSTEEMQLLVVSTSLSTRKSNMMMLYHMEWMFFIGKRNYFDGSTKKYANAGS